MMPLIFHVDANSAFLSWTAAYQVNVLGRELDLRTVPSVIAGNKETRQGIVLAKHIWQFLQPFNVQLGYVAHCRFHEVVGGVAHGYFAQLVRHWVKPYGKLAIAIYLYYSVLHFVTQTMEFHAVNAFWHLNREESVVV